MPAKLLIVFIIISSFIACSHQGRQKKTVAPTTVYQCDNGYEFYTTTITQNKNDAVTLERPQGECTLTHRPSPSGEEYTNGKVLWWSYKNTGFIKSVNTPILDLCVITNERSPRR